MAQITATRSTPTVRTTGRTIARWLVSFAGFPMGGGAAWLLTGPVDSPAQRARRRADHRARPRRRPGLGDAG